jgi:hypothetical protein
VRVSQEFHVEPMINIKTIVEKVDARCSPLERNSEMTKHVEARELNKCFGNDV